MNAQRSLISFTLALCYAAQGFWVLPLGAQEESREISKNLTKTKDATAAALPGDEAQGMKQGGEQGLGMQEGQAGASNMQPPAGTSSGGTQLRPEKRSESQVNSSPAGAGKQTVKSGKELALQASTFPLVYLIALPVAMGRGTVDELRTETRECHEQTKSKAIAAAGTVVFLPLSAVAGILRAPVLAGVKIFSSKPLSKEAFSLKGDLDLQEPPDIYH